MANSNKIDLLGYGEFVLNLHKQGLSNLEITTEIKSKYNVYISPQIVYRWLKINYSEYMPSRYQNASKPQSENLPDEITIDLSNEIRELIKNPINLANICQENLLKSLAILTFTTSKQLELYAMGKGKIPLNDIKSLKTITEIIEIITSKNYSENTHLQIKKSLVGDTSINRSDFQ